MEDAMAIVEAKGVVIDRPVGEVWRFMVDSSNMHLWEDSGAHWAQTSEGPVDLDTTFTSSIRKLGREMKTDLRVAEFELNKTFAVEATSGFAKGTRLRYVMASVEGGKTRLNRVTDMRLRGLARLLRPIEGITKVTGEMEAKSVKRVMESRP
jgi:hypothetical protein